LARAESDAAALIRHSDGCNDDRREERGNKRLGDKR
jgi:hypothetical protein